MATTIITKYGSGAPTASDVVRGELAVDTENGRLYTEDSGGSVIEIGLNPSGNVDVTGTVTADGLTVGDSSSSFTLATIQSSTSGESELRMGDTDTDAGSISYTNSDDTMTFRAAAAARMSLNSTGLDVTGTVTADGLHVTTSSGNSYLEVGRATQAQGEVGLKISGGTSGADWYLYQKPSADTLHFYKTGDRVTIDSSGNVGIGVSSPTGLLTLGTGTFSAAAANTSALYTSTTAGLVAVADGFLLVDRAGADVFKVDTDGDVGIGNSTVASTRLAVTGSVVGANIETTSSNAGHEGLIVNRQNSDGTAIAINKAGSTAGSIGTLLDGLYIGSPAGTDAYIGFTNSIVYPSTSAGVGRDAAIDLGTSDHRFKDLYLSGGLYVGGTGAANKLDDYEEGTWTPSLSASSTNPTPTAVTVANAT